MSQLRFLDRRELMKLGSVATSGGNAFPMGAAAPNAPSLGAPIAADHTVRIATGLIELSPEHIVSTTLYNGQFPGPLLRFKEGQQVTVDIHNDTDTPELLHWHGQMIPSEVDGAAEEGTPFVPAHGTCRISLVPKPAGFRFYHTHVAAEGDLSRGTYTGQAGPVYIEPRHNPGAYHREVFEVDYELFAINGRTRPPGDRAKAKVSRLAAEQLRGSTPVRLKIRASSHGEIARPARTPGCTRTERAGP